MLVYSRGEKYSQEKMFAISRKLEIVILIASLISFVYIDAHLSLQKLVIAKNKSPKTGKTKL